jgi:hypothetical protein
VLIYSPTISSRLQYIADFSGKEITGESFKITSDLSLYQKENSAKINYSSERINEEELWIKPHSLLFEDKIKEQAIDCFEANKQKAFFKTEGDFHFDIFAATFYLLSRYEEYVSHQKDMYGRYAHQNSLAFKESFLNQPLINIWFQQFKNVLKQKFPQLIIYQSPFTFLPTYDIDIAWSCKHKGFRRSIGGLLQSILKGNFKQFKERINVFRGRQKDPYDTYSWMNGLHEQYKLKPYYFFLLAHQSGRYDKNILPHKKALRDLISDHLIRYPVGIHPSWRSGDQHWLLEKEINILSAISGNKVLSSRQHYIRFILPETFQRLIDAGIRFDFSMGYGSINGFRASVATPFYWYDLEKEKKTELLLFPFCYMDANSFYEQKLTARQGLEEMRHYYNVTKSVNGTFIMIWHNQFFGTDKLFLGWKEVYEEFIKETSDDFSV